MYFTKIVFLKFPLRLPKKVGEKAVMHFPVQVTPKAHLQSVTHCQVLRIQTSRLEENNIDPARLLDEEESFSLQVHNRENVDPAINKQLENTHIGSSPAKNADLDLNLDDLESEIEKFSES